MTSGEIINARARAGARMAEARAALARAAGLRASSPLLYEGIAEAARLAEEEHEAWGIIERAEARRRKRSKGSS